MVEQAIKDILNTVMLVTFLGGLGLAGAYMLSLLLRGTGEAARGIGEGAGATFRGLGEFLASAGSAARDLAGGLGDFVRGSRSDRSDRDVHRLVDYAPRLRSRERLGALDVGAYLGLAAGVKAVRGVGRRVRRASKRARRAAKRTMRRTLQQVAADARATWRASTSPRWTADWTAEEPPLWEWGVPQEAAEDFMRTLDEAGVPYTAYVAPDGTVRVAVEDPDLAREAVAAAGWVEVEPPSPVAAAPVEVFDPETGEWISYDEDGLTETPVPDPSAGGTALVRKYGTGYMRELGRRGGLARWKE